MARLVGLLAVVALVASAMLAFVPASSPVAAQPIATTRALLGQGDDAPTPTAGEEDDDEDEQREAPDRPEGIPDAAVAAEVTGHIDGDKFTIIQEGDEGEVLLNGVDAPETDEGPEGECYAADASERLEELVPRGETVFLLSGDTDTDNKDRLLRFVWVDDDGESIFVNEAMLDEGFASFQAREGNVEYDAALKSAEQDARDDENGLWGACGDNHVEIVPPTPTPELGDGDLPAPVGTQLTGEDVAVTVASAFYANEYGFSTPKGGYVYLVIEVAIENIDDADHGYAGNRFSAKDFDTNAEFDDTFTLTDGGLGAGTLSPGEYVSGIVVLEVQETVQRIRIKYDTAAIGGTNLYWLVE